MRGDPKSSTKSRLQFLFFMLIFYYLMCNVCILQASRKDVASIHTSLASCEYYDWSVLAASILHARFVPKIRMRKHSMRTNVGLQYACCTFAACMLRTQPFYLLGRSLFHMHFFFCLRLSEQTSWWED